LKISHQSAPVNHYFGQSDIGLLTHRISSPQVKDKKLLMADYRMGSRQDVADTGSKSISVFGAHPLSAQFFYFFFPLTRGHESFLSVF
jgi:hypothetical protein